MAKNLLVVTLLVLACVLNGCTRSSRDSTPNVVLIIVDTLAVNHLGTYGHPSSPSPNIDKLAESGTVFEKAYTPAPWTKPAVSSVFTGVMPSMHGVKSIDDVLPESFNTLAERLKRTDYLTAGFVSHTLISPKLGYAQGFDTYDTVPFKGNVHSVISSEKVTDMGLDWLKSYKENYKERSDSNKFFLFLHYFDPHNNYQHHKEFDQTSWYKGDLTPGMDIRAIRAKIPNITEDDVKYLRGLYDEEIAHTDREIGRFLGTLKDMGLSDNTIIILTADHGEEFFDHGSIGHSRTLFDELTRVPLIISYPGKVKPQRVSEPVTTLDILPTVLDEVNLNEDRQGLAGISLKETLLEGKELPRRDIYSEVDFKSSYIKAYKISVVRGIHKAVLDKPTQSCELYDLESDPKELSNISSKDPALFSTLSSLVIDYQNKYQKNSQNEEMQMVPERSSEEIEQLKSLGYL